MARFKNLLPSPRHAGPLGTTLELSGEQLQKWSFHYIPEVMGKDTSAMCMLTYGKQSWICLIPAHRDAEKHLKRLHQTTPLIQSPLAGADHDKLVFSQRHEANSVELFFDLFFAANLATFTTYHSITDSNYLLGYIGFFGIVWSCWFQVTMHDVRFARDSMYERVCKTTQFIVFAGLALVGSDFNPGAAKGNNVVSTQDHLRGTICSRG